MGQSHDTVYYPNGRCPRYLYSSWYDTTGCYYDLNHTSLRTYRVGYSPTAFIDDSGRMAYVAAPLSVVKREYVQYPTLLSGVALMTSPENRWPYDSTRAPDTCFVFTYDEDFNVVTLLGTTRWDTATPWIWKMPMNVDTTREDAFNYCTVYEARFPHPVPVDSFYWIGSTSHNNTMLGSYPLHPSFWWAAVCEHYPDPPIQYTCHSPYSRTKYVYLENGETITFQDDYGGFFYGAYGPLMPILSDAPAETVVLSTAPMDSTMGWTTPHRDVVPKWFFQTIKAHPYPGYAFDHWSDGSRENPYRIQMTTSYHYVAHFVLNQCTVSVDAPDKRGSVLGGGVYTGFDTVELFAVPDEGFRFSHWHDSVTDNPRRFVALYDTAFYAYFEEITDTSSTTDTTGIAPIADASSLFTLTPNPTTGEVTVTLGQPPLTLTHSSVSKADSWLHWRSPTFGSPNLGEQLRRLTLTIHDAAGNEVMRKELVRPGISISLDLSDFPAGVYFVTLTTPTASGTQKLVVK